MTGMLASVASVSEAEIVLDEGADIIDLKNPQLGALGALDINLVAEIVNAVKGAVLTSATIGDIESNAPKLLESIYAMAATGIDIVKVGLFGSQASSYFLDAIKKAVQQEIKLVIVLFAENYVNIESIESLLETNIIGVMLDTKNKNGKRLCDILNYSELKEFVDKAKSYRLLTGLAGSLQYGDIESLLNLKPDYLGFRGALCSGNKRINQVDQFKIKKIRNAIPVEEIINYDNSNDHEEVLKNGTMA